MSNPTPQERWDAAGKAKDGYEAYDLLYSAWPEKPTARLFTLERDTDVSGISGTGTVADGVVWPDGSVTVRWRGNRPSTVNWGRIEDVEAINGHGGATRIVYAAERRETDDEPWPREKPMPSFTWGDRGAHYRQALLEYWDARGETPRNHADPTTASNAVDWWNERAQAERERLVHENPELAAQIREGVAEAERGETVDLGSFAQHLDERDDDD